LIVFLKVEEVSKVPEVVKRLCEGRSNLYYTQSNKESKVCNENPCALLALVANTSLESRRS
jgi:hypothetical protein